MVDKRAERPILIAASVTLFLAFLFCIVAVATPGWSNDLKDSLLNIYQSSEDDEKSGLLWLIGVVVLVILCILSLCFSAVIIVARLFGHSKGRAKLAGFLSIFGAAVLIIALGIFMGVKSPNEVTYGYSFGLAWVAVPLAIASGVIMLFIKDTDFLKTDLATYSASMN